MASALNILDQGYVYLKTLPIFSGTEDVLARDVKGECVSGFCERSGITEEEFYLHGDAVLCDCSESCCDG